MSITIQLVSTRDTDKNTAYICQTPEQLANYGLSAVELDYVNKQQQNNKDLVVLNRYDDVVFIVFVKTDEPESKRLSNAGKLVFHVVW